MREKQSASKNKDNLWLGYGIIFVVFLALGLVYMWFDEVIIVIKKFNAVINIFQILGIFIGIWILYLNLTKTNTQIQLQEANNLNTDFTQAIKLLDSDRKIIRTGALIALHNIALDNEKYRSEIIDIIASHVRTKTNEDEYTKKYCMDDDKPSNEIQKALDILFKGDNCLNIKREKWGIQEPINLSEAQLQGADFSFAHCEEVNFHNAHCQKTDFSYADCEGSNFNEAKFQGAYFNGTNCQRADFKKADFQDSYFGDAYCDEVDFSNAKFQGTDFSYADCEGSNFNEAKFQGANFDNAVFSKDNLNKNVGPMIVEGAFGIAIEYGEIHKYFQDIYERNKEKPIKTLSDLAKEMAENKEVLSVEEGIKKILEKMGAKFSSKIKLAHV